MPQPSTAAQVSKAQEAAELSQNEYPADGTSWKEGEGTKNPITLQTPMDWEEGNDVELASLPLLEKRKKPGTSGTSREIETSTEEEEVIRSVRRKSRSQKPRNQVASDDGRSDQEQVRAKKVISAIAGKDARIGQLAGRMLPPSGEGTQSCSEHEMAGKLGPEGNGIRDRQPRKRRGVDELTIEEQPRPVPTRLEELEAVPMAQSIAAAMKWLEDIELIRGRSSYQPPQLLVGLRVRTIEEVLGSSLTYRSPPLR